MQIYESVEFRLKLWMIHFKTIHSSRKLLIELHKYGNSCRINVNEFKLIFVCSQVKNTKHYDF